MLGFRHRVLLSRAGFVLALVLLWLLLSWIVSIDMPQVPTWFDGVSHTTLQFLGLGEPTVSLPVPEKAVLDRWVGVRL